MSDADFYSCNLRRNYPFVDESVGIAWQDTDDRRAAVLDIGIVFYPNAEFDSANDEHRVLPEQIGPDGDLLFYVSASGAAIDGISFSISPLANADWTRSEGLISSGGVVYGYFWVLHGLNQSGGFSYLSFIAADPLSVPYIEPHCIQVLNGHYVDKFVVANAPRIVVPGTRSGMSSSSVIASGDYPYAPGGEEVSGDVRFSEGYNCLILASASNNALRFSVRKGAGEGEPCEEIPRTYAELNQAARGEYLDRATRCHEVISNINGVEPDISGNFKLQGGRGVEVTSPSAHTIKIEGHESMEDCE